MKLSEFNLVKKESEITPETFIVIIGITIWTPDYPLGDRNVVIYDNKKYIVCYFKGLYKNILKTSNDILSDKLISVKCKIPNNIKIFVGGIQNGIFEGLMHPTMQDLINDNLVLCYPHRIDFDIDDDVVIYAIENNVKFNPPSIN